MVLSLFSSFLCSIIIFYFATTASISAFLSADFYYPPVFLALNVLNAYAFYAALVLELSDLNL